MPPAPSSKDILAAVSQSPGHRVKIAVVDIDGILRGKYIHKEKFASAVEGGFGFCDVVYGWDMHDVCYDNTTITGWHKGFPDAIARIDLATHRNVPWDDGVDFFLGSFVQTRDGKEEALPIDPGPPRRDRQEHAHPAAAVDPVDEAVGRVGRRQRRRAVLVPAARVDPPAQRGGRPRGRDQRVVTRRVGIEQVLAVHELRRHRPRGDTVRGRDRVECHRSVAGVRLLCSRSGRRQQDAGPHDSGSGSTCVHVSPRRMKARIVCCALPGRRRDP